MYIKCNTLVPIQRPDGLAIIERWWRKIYVKKPRAIWDCQLLPAHAGQITSHHISSCCVRKNKLQTEQWNKNSSPDLYCSQPSGRPGDFWERCTRPASSHLAHTFEKERGQSKLDKSSFHQNSNESQSYMLHFNYLRKSRTVTGFFRKQMSTCSLTTKFHSVPLFVCGFSFQVPLAQIIQIK